MAPRAHCRTSIETSFAPTPKTIMKFVIAFACLIASASAVPLATYAVAPAAVTYQTQSQSLVPVGTKVYTSVSHGPAIVQAAPLVAPLAAPLAHGIAAPLAAPIAPLGLGAPLGLAAPLGLGAPLAAPLGLGYSKTILSSPAVLAGPVLH